MAEAESASEREARLDRKIKAIRERNQKLVERAKLVDDDVKEACKHQDGSVNLSQPAASDIAVSKCHNSAPSASTGTKKLASGRIIGSPVSAQSTSPKSNGQDRGSQKSQRSRKSDDDNHKTIAHNSPMVCANDLAWRKEREMIDRARIKHTQDSSGQWKREWDKPKKDKAPAVVTSPTHVPKSPRNANAVNNADLKGAQQRPAGKRTVPVSKRDAKLPDISKSERVDEQRTITNPAGAPKPQRTRVRGRNKNHGTNDRVTNVEDLLSDSSCGDVDTSALHNNISSTTDSRTVSQVGDKLIISFGATPDVGDNAKQIEQAGQPSVENEGGDDDDEAAWEDVSDEEEENV